MTTDTLEALREAAVNAATALEVMGLSEAVVVNGERDLKAEALTVANRLRLALSRIDAALAASPAPTLGVERERPFGLSPLEQARIKAPLIEALNAAWEHGNACGEGDNPEPFDPVARATAVLDHIGDATTKVSTLGVEGVARIIRQHVKGATIISPRGHLLPGLGVEGAEVAARAIIAAMEKQDGATLGVARTKATIWKHWRNQNGQTLEDRFTAAAEEIAAMEKNDG